MEFCFMSDLFNKEDGRKNIFPLILWDYLVLFIRLRIKLAIAAHRSLSWNENTKGFSFLANTKVL